ncbi:alpha/beta fold hydrolase [Mycobacterium sp. URHB0044]|uniref:alpha/beta fold hydrolase n=1 Tax=Mycobacterium sp. URHB0044 TaxID=1380386 RepID=UPI00048DB84D|nr:alpha/beta hydrolase [Mycobacterium sp. URHB0044]
MSGDFVDTSVGRLYVETDGDGPPALLWHSLFIDSTSWELLRPKLAQHRRLIVVDGPGHGRSGHPDGDYRIADCAAAAIEVLDALRVSGPIDWVGNAWGGHIGIAFAAQHPDHCRTLVTIGTPVHALNTTERLTQIIPLLAGYRVAGPIGFVYKPLFDALLGAEAAAAQPDLTARLVNSFRSAGRSAMYRAILSVSLRRPDLTNLLPDVTAPTLMAACQDDPGWNYDQAMAAVAKMPNGRAVKVRGTGHVAPVLLEPDLLVSRIAELWG